MDRLSRLIRRLTPGGSRTERIVKSGVWVMGQNVAGRGMQLVMLIVLARLIGPREIGLVGIALLALSAMRKFTKIGLNAALVQQSDQNVDQYLDTNWTLEIARGGIVTVVLVASAPVIGSLFGEPRAVPILRVIGLSPLVLGLRNPGIVYFQKHLEFHKQFVYRISGEFVALVVAIGYALVSPTAWAYVLGFLAADVVRLVVSYLIHDYRPRLRLDTDRARELIDYGKWITGSSILYFLYSEGDDAFVGWLIGPAALGLYQYGYRLSNAPATELSQVVSRVMFPAFSEYQDEPERLRERFLQTMQMISLVAFPMAFGIAVVAPSFVRTFLGSEWTGMITAMQLLAVYGLLRSVGKPFGSLWKAVGRPDIITKLSALRVVLLGVGIYPATARWGITGTAALVTGVFLFVMMPIDLFIITRTVGTSFRSLASEFGYPLLASGLMAGVVWYVSVTVPLPTALEFFVLVAVGGVTYAGLVALIADRSDWDVSHNVRQLVGTL